MRNHLASAAAVSVVLVLGACSGPGQADGTATPSATTSAPESSTASGPEPHSTVQTCAGYYDGGEYSVDHRVTTWGTQLDALDEAGAVEVTVVRDRLSSLLLYADDETTSALEALRTPFQDALTDGEGDPEQVEEAATAFRALCEDAGYDLAG
jgi:hypothetical protein